ncbi:MAG: alkaline phosphatase D family protein [Myxococcales bacterium]|nr:alkaline phosphatase D family protein [Myxococcales bacterium]
MDRRKFIQRSSLLATLPLLPSCEAEPGEPALPTYSWTGTAGPETLFSHGVASGDPLSTSVLLWTRVTVDGTALEGKETRVFWEIATDIAFTDRVGAGEVTTAATRDYTVKIVAEELDPQTTYYYRFFTQGRGSPIGRTRTTNVGATAHIRLAFCSCANYVRGYFTGYRELANHNDLDAILHLGDYIYEAQYDGKVRQNKQDKETITLSDYRIRYAHYRSDKDLQEAHRQHPFICVWDDHETANNSYKDGAGAHKLEEDGMWSDRKAAATQAWREWLPVRESDDGRIWRKHAWGDLVDLFMLDTRLWARAEQVTATQKDALADPNRPLLGADQEKWLHTGLSESKARWKVLGQQVMVATIAVNGIVINTDQWDGYSATRDRLYKTARDNSVDGLVVLTGDIHSSWANDLVEDSSDDKTYDKTTGKGALGVEFVVPGITSTTFGAGGGIGDIAQQFNSHIRWVDMTRRGYCLLDLTHERVQCDWFLFETVDTPGTKSFHGASFMSPHGSGHLTKVTDPAKSKASAPKGA